MGYRARRAGFVAAMALACAACNRGATTDPAAVPDVDEPAATAARAVRLAPAATSPAVAHGAPVDTAFWLDGDDAYVLSAAGIAGLELIGPDGARIAAVTGIEAGLVTVVPDVGIADRKGPIAVVYDAGDSTTSAYRLEADGPTLSPLMSEPIAVDDELTGLCHYRSRLSGSDYLYAVTDGGFIHQFELYAESGGLRARLLRTVASGKGSAWCAVDPRDGTLYVSEESSGIWRLGAEPESDPTREPVDLRAPFGSLGEEVKGIAVYPVDARRSYLVAADPEAGLVVYRLPEGERVAVAAVPGLSEAEGMAATTASLGGTWPAGLLAVADESLDEGGPNVKLIDWRALAEASGLDTATAQADTAGPAVVRPVVETDVMPSFGDAADDPAIWVHPDDPAESLVIGTNKQGGLHVYDLEGRTVQVLPDGMMNNVDLRDGFPLGGERVTLVTASNRSNDSIAAYRIDADARRLVDVASGLLATGFSDPYGLCMYRSAASGDFYVFVNEGGDGTVRQWRLVDDGSGKVAIEKVREFAVGSQAEGCVADDRTGRLYVAEEDVGLWRYSAEPDAGNERQRIDDVASGRLTDDVEGVTLWQGSGDGGYLVVSNQGADNFALYRRDGDNEYIGHFHVVANPAAGVDGASETDGLDVTSAALGARFPDGLLVVQDGRNIAPEEAQNFKYVSWSDVASAMQESPESSAR